MIHFPFSCHFQTAFLQNIHPKGRRQCKRKALLLYRFSSSVSVWYRGRTTVSRAGCESSTFIWWGTILLIQHNFSTLLFIYVGWDNINPFKIVSCNFHCRSLYSLTGRSPKQNKTKNWWKNDFLFVKKVELQVFFTAVASFLFSCGHC